jgi:glycosyltransferase involved in cell wall biosynthesis
MIKCFEQQTYPKDRIEWIIVDDGTDPIDDLVAHIPQVKYYYYDKKMLLGKKRNEMHKRTKGDILVYMDDDDYYPPQRIAHAVELLQQNPSFLLAGSSEMHIYFDKYDNLFQCGPYKENHATAATFAFKRELLKETSYDEENALAEETKFTKSYTIPLIQLDPLKSILVFSHRHNSLNKEKLLETPQQCKITDSPYSVDDFIEDAELRQFYTHDMNHLLEGYAPGRPENKPILMAQIKSMKEKRESILKEQQKYLELQKIYNAKQSIATYNIEKQLEEKNIIINELLKKVKQLTNELAEMKGVAATSLSRS